MKSCGCKSTKAKFVRRPKSKSVKRKSIRRKRKSIKRRKRKSIRRKRKSIKGSGKWPWNKYNHIDESKSEKPTSEKPASVYSDYEATFEHVKGEPKKESETSKPKPPSKSSKK